MSIAHYLAKVVKELGLASVYNSSRDTKLLLVQRFVRLFAYGGSTLILVLFLSALDISDERIGSFMSLTSLGNLVISFCLTLVADSLGRKVILAAGAMLMVMSGLVFAFCSNFWVLLMAAIFGVISPSGSEIGPFRAIEESTLAHLSPSDVRSDIYAWYALLGSAGSAFGLITCGWVVNYLRSLDGWEDIRSYQVIFFAYAVLGIVKLALALSLSKNVEAEKVEELPLSDLETTPFLEDGALSLELKVRRKKRIASLLPSISAESREIVVPLCSLFMLDSLGSGLVPLSWLTAFFERKFNIQEGTLGTLFFTTSIIAAFSSLVASSISKRIGNVKTMVFTHLPSSIFLALIPLPKQFDHAVVLLILGSCMYSMDIAPRSTFLAAVILPNERTAVMGIINLMKTLSASIGPSITGWLSTKELFWVSFVLAGTVKVIYDLGILVMFVGHVTREEKAKAMAMSVSPEPLLPNVHAEEPS